VIEELSLIDLFAGCGGLSLGLEQAGFRPVLFSELDKDAGDTYARNRLERPPIRTGDIGELLNGDIKALIRSRNAEIGRIDLVCGGPPCQGYSGIGHRRTFKIERESIPSNHLYKAMIAVIEQVQPRMFLFENVRGLKSGRWTKDGRPGEIWEDVFGAFRAIEGYRVSTALLEAGNYGVPQNRPRVFIVGISLDLGWEIDESPDAIAEGLLPKPSSFDPPTIEQVIGDLVDRAYPRNSETKRYPRSAKGDYQEEMRTSRDGKRHGWAKGSPLTEHLYSRHSDRVRERFEQIISGKPIPPRLQTRKFAQRVLPKTWIKSGGRPTITATSLPDDFVHYSQPRSLTVREWARIQSFPDWYEFAGKRTTGGRRRAGNPENGDWAREVPKYTQIGNAVPVRLARSIGVHLAKIIRAGTSKTPVRTRTR
jgi:DNA (cytosine-5)-methyltransferase 1